MKPPPGPMIQLSPTSRRPPRPSRPSPSTGRPGRASTVRPVTRTRRRGTTLAALALATGLLFGGVAALAPYADATGPAGPTSSSVDGH